MKRPAFLLRHLLPLLLLWGGQVIAETTVMVVEHSWTFRMGDYIFGMSQFAPRYDNSMPGEQILIRPRTTGIYFGHWYGYAEGYSAPVLASGLAVLAGLLVVASGVLIRRRRHEPLPKRGSS